MPFLGIAPEHIQRDAVLILRREYECRRSARELLPRPFPISSPRADSCEGQRGEGKALKAK